MLFAEKAPQITPCSQRGCSDKSFVWLSMISDGIGIFPYHLLFLPILTPPQKLIFKWIKRSRFPLNWILHTYHPSSVKEDHECLPQSGENLLWEVFKVLHLKAVSSLELLEKRWKFTDWKSRLENGFNLFKDLQSTGDSTILFFLSHYLTFKCVPPSNLHLAIFNH